MKDKLIQYLAILAVACTGVSQAGTVTVTVEDDGVSNIGAVGTFYWALTNCQPGDTIAFNISPTGSTVHYLVVPPNGFPLVYQKNNLTIDGYTQTGSSRNTHAITAANNAALKIVVDGRNGNSRNMVYTAYDGTLAKSDPPINNTAIATERCGYGADEPALLGIYRSTNVNIRGIAFLGASPNTSGLEEAIAFAHDFGGDATVEPNMFSYPLGSDAYGHVNGCWFGVNPTNVALNALEMFGVGVTAYRHQDAPGGLRPELGNIGLTVGVAAGSANPRAEFNVFAGTGGAIDTESQRTRFSGNFVNVMPDGVTDVPFLALYQAGFSQGWSIGINRYDDTEPIIIGTDGDGVNDADEGNLFGPMGPPSPVVAQGPLPMFNVYHTANKPWIIAGNTFGVAVNGTLWDNNCFFIMDLQMNEGSKVRFGSDFNGVSDALEANVVNNNNVWGSAPFMWDSGVPGYGSVPSPSTAKDLFGFGTANPANGAFLSVRGNKLVNNFPVFNPGDLTPGPFQRDNLTGVNYTNFWGYFVTDTTKTIPVLSGSSSISTLIGTFGVPLNTSSLSNVVVDVYLPDPAGQTHGAEFNEPEFGGLAGWGFVQGKTYLGSYAVTAATGAFSLNITSLGIAHGTAVTVAATYYAVPAQPVITGISRSGNNVTLTWSGGTGGGTFAVLHASSVTGPWTTFAYTPLNSYTLTDASTAQYYRIQTEGAGGMTTLFAKPVTLP